MGSKVRVVFLLPLLGVALALAGGTMEAGLAGTGPCAAAALQMMAPSTPLTPPMGSELRRRVLSNISPSSLDPNRAACLRSCPAAGRAYTGSGCQKVYQCSG